MIVRLYIVPAITAFLLHSIIVNAQSPDTLWARTYGGADIEVAESAFEIPGEGFIIGGYSASYSSLGFDYFLVKTDLNGDTIWTRTYGIEGLNDILRCVIRTNDGGFILAGSRYYEDTSSDIYIVKTYANGQLEWERLMGDSSGYEVCTWIDQTIDNGYVITGGYLNIDTFADIFLIKLDSTGNVLWEQQYDWPRYDIAYCVQQTQDEGFILCGHGLSVNPHNEDVLLMKLDSNGDSLWVHAYGGPAEEYGYCVKETDIGGYVIVGFTASFGAGLYDIYIVNTDHNGSFNWQRTFGGPQFDRAYQVELTNDGCIVVAGYTSELGTDDIFLAKLNPSGDSLWVSRLESEGDQVAAAIQQTSDEGYIVGASTDALGAGSFDLWLLKYGSETVIPICDDPVLPSKLSYYQNYPNPFNASTTIRFVIPESQYVKLTVYDLLGRRVENLLDEYKQAGAHSVSFDASHLSSGVYFYRLQAGERVETKRMVLLK